MSTQTITIKADIPQEGFAKLKEISADIKDALKDLIQPIKDIRDSLAPVIKPQVDTSGLETASTVAEGIAATLGIVAATLAAFPEPSGATFVAAAIAGIAAAVAALASWMLSLDWGAIGEWFGGLWDGMENGSLSAQDHTVSVWNDIQESLQTVWDTVGQPILNAWNEAVEALGKVWDSLWTNCLNPIVSNIMNVMSALWENTLRPMFEKIGNSIGKVSELVLLLWNKSLAPVLDFFVNLFGPYIAAVVNNTGNIFGTVFKAIGGVINGFLDAFNGVLDFLCGIFTGDWKRALSGLVNIFIGFGNMIISIFEGVVNRSIDLVNGLVSLVWGAIKGIVNSILGAVEWIAKWIGFDLNIKITAAAPQITKLSVTRIPLASFAQGGFPDTGQMFLAREAGPELVGTIGSRTAVVNNDQIVQSVSAGVYDAVRSAMSGFMRRGSMFDISTDAEIWHMLPSMQAA